jgi:hypothetical protein
MNRILPSLVAALLIFAGTLVGAEFDRQTFLAAVKDKIKAQPGLMQSDPRSLRRIAVVKPVSEAFRRYLANEPPAEAWQRDLIAIPVRALLPNGEKATFEIAVAYLASIETGTPLTALVTLEGRNPSNIQDGLRLRNFVGGLLPAMFDENRPCSFPGFYLYSPSEAQFANSICTDLKQIVLDVRREYAGAQILVVEKQNGNTLIQRSHSLLTQAKGYDNLPVVEASVAALEAAVAGDDVNVIRARAQALITANRDLDQFISDQKARAAALVKARETANQELVKTRTLLKQATGYDKTSKVASAQKPLESALTGENVDEITARTQALVAVNRDIDRFIQDQKAGAETKQRQENQVRAFAAAKQRADRAIESAKVEIATASQWTGDRAVATAVKEMKQSVDELSVKLKGIDPQEEPAISRLTDRLASSEHQVKLLTRQSVVLSSATGKRVYDGCYAWAKRGGLIAGSQVRVFKDEETNKAAQAATNPGEPFCRCVAVTIAGDNRITDEAKLAIAHDMETKDKEDNEQLRVVVGAAFGNCQIKMLNDMTKK